MSDKKPTSPDFEGTRIDLGEDLLEHAAPGSPEVKQVQLIPPELETVESLFETAKILFGENMLEEAKKVLHGILSRDSKHAPASAMLTEIHKKELQQLFSDERAPDYRAPQYPEVDFENIDREAILRKLDEDLDLGLTTPSLPSLLADANSLATLSQSLNHSLREASPQDRIDIGIGFLEMGVHALAIDQFRQAAQTWAENSDPRVVTAATLLALAQILSGHPFDATMSLYSVANDAEINIHDKSEIFYLMGRANEDLRKYDVAVEWYQKTEALDPFYRDNNDHLAHCLKQSKKQIHEQRNQR